MPSLKEKPTDNVLPLEDNAEDIKVVSVVATSTTTVTSTTAAATTTTKPPSEKNMERFWRFTAPPRRRGEPRSSIAAVVRKLSTVNSTPVAETEETSTVEKPESSKINEAVKTDEQQRPADRRTNEVRPEEQTKVAQPQQEEQQSKLFMQPHDTRTAEQRSRVILPPHQ